MKTIVTALFLTVILAATCRAQYGYYDQPIYPWSPVQPQGYPIYGPYIPPTIYPPRVSVYIIDDSFGGGYYYHRPFFRGW